MHTPFNIQCEAIENAIGESIKDEHAPAILDALEALGCYVTTHPLTGSPTINGPVSDDKIIDTICEVIASFQSV